MHIYFLVPAGLRYQERDIAKFQGENIPSKTFKYLQYITQEELALEEQERRQRAMNPPAQPQPEVVAQPMRPAQPVSSYLNIEPRKPLPYQQPKVLRNGPISFQNSGLNMDRNKINMTTSSTNYNQNNTKFNSTSSIFDLKNNNSEDRSSNQTPASYPFANSLNYEPPKNLPEFNNNPQCMQQQPEVVSQNQEITSSISTTQQVFKEESVEPVECSFLPSEASCNETTFTFNNISDQSSNSHEQQPEAPQPAGIL